MDNVTLWGRIADPLHFLSVELYGGAKILLKVDPVDKVDPIDVTQKLKLIARYNAC